VITDAAGEHVRTFDGPHEPGINEILWDWRYDRPYDPPRGGGGGGPGGFGGGAPEGPIVMPGMYTVTVNLGGTSSSETVRIEADPRRPMAIADRRARQDALMSLHRLAGPLNDATQAARTLDGQLDEAAELLEDFEGDTDMLQGELETIQAELEEVSEGLGEARRWTGVAGAIQGSSTLPTEDQLWQIDAAWDAVPPLVERLNTLIMDRIPAFNTSLNEMGVRPSPGERLTVPSRGR